VIVLEKDTLKAVCSVVWTFFPMYWNIDRFLAFLKII